MHGKWRCRFILGVIIGVMLFGGMCSLPCRGEKLFDKTARKQLMAYLWEVCGWIGASNTADAESHRKKDDNGSILINAYFTRALLAAAPHSQNPKEIQDAALNWCDSFAGRQTPLTTSKGTAGGFWLDHGQRGELNLTSAGASAYTLVLACSRTDGTRRQGYLSVLQKYAGFVLDGCTENPLKKGGPGVAGWRIQQGKDQGAFSSAMEATPSALSPSSSSTAVHVALFAGLARLTQEPRYREVALSGMDWLLKNRRANGETIYLEKGDEDDERLFLSAASLSEAIQACYYQLENPQLNEKFIKILGPTLRWLVLAQSERGWWGDGENRLGSPGIASLLLWDFQFGSKSRQAPEVLDKYWQAISNPVHRQSFGVGVLGLPSGLVALSIAEALTPGSTYR
jgi:hypothetical protein